MIINPEDEATNVFSSDWIVLASRPDILEKPEWHGRQRRPMPDPNPELWTDDYSNLLRIVR